MTTILPALPDSQRYTVTTYIDASALDKAKSDSAFRRTRLGMPLSRTLIKAGFLVEDWTKALQAASVIAREGKKGTIVVTATVPRPHVIPDGELNPEREIKIEYVGGPDDGHVETLDMDGTVPPTLGVALNGSVYSRAAYDLSAGVWLYQRVRPAAPNPQAEVEDPAVWEDEE